MLLRPYWGQSLRVFAFFAVKNNIQRMVVWLLDEDLAETVGGTDEVDARSETGLLAAGKVVDAGGPFPGPSPVKEGRCEVIIELYKVDTNGNDAVDAALQEQELM